MLRKLVGAAVLLALLAGPAGAQEKKPANMLFGKIKKIDADKSTLVLEVRKEGGKTEDAELKIDDNTKFITFVPNKGRKELSGKEGLKAESFKAGAQVQVITDPEGKVIRVVAIPTSPHPPIGPATGQGAGQFTQGKIKKIDADKETIVLELIGRDGKKHDTTVTVTPQTRFMAMTHEGRKQYNGKEGLKAKEFKVGTEVQYFKSPDGKMQGLVAFAGKFTNAENPNNRPQNGTIKKVDSEKGVVVLMINKKEVKVEVTPSTRFFVLGQGPRKEYTGKEGLKAKEFKEGTQVQYVKSPDGKHQVLMVFAGGSGYQPNPLGRPLSGKIKKIDAKKGILTLLGVQPDADKAVDIKITGKTKFMVASREGRKELTAKEAEKADQFKPGTAVNVHKDPEGNALMVIAGPYAVPPKLGDK